jgi:sarcosine oxidase
MNARDADVIVVGLGAMGAMTLWRLARRGIDVLGIEQFDIANTLGSSGGQTRLFRTACFEHPRLGVMARHALRLWRELEAVSRSEILTLTGGVMIGASTGELIEGARAAARAGGTEVMELSVGDLTERFPAHINLDPSHVGLWDPGAGVVRPERGITAAIEVASRLGARVLTNTRVQRIAETGSGVEVATETKTLRARSVVVAAGPWLSKLMGTPRLEPRRVIMTWFKPTAPLDTDALPVFIRCLSGGGKFWGHGEIDGLPVKVGAPDDGGDVLPFGPDAVDRTVHNRDIVAAREIVSRFLQGMDAEPTASSVCMITLSPDLQFVLGPRERDSAIILGGGCSGHAFKHAPAIGEFLASAATRQAPPFSGGFMDPTRFTERVAV